MKTSWTTLAVTAMAMAACSSSHNVAGTRSPDGSGAGGSADPAADASGAVGASAAGNEAGVGRAGDANGEPPPRTITPVTPGVWRDITPPSLRGTIASTTPCTDIQFDPGNRSTLYSMFGTVGIMKSTDAGGTWTPIVNFPTPTSLGRILIDPKNPNHIYATGSVMGSSLGFWVSHDGGNTFAIPPAFTTGANTIWVFDVYNLVADPTDFNHIVMTFHNAWRNMPNAGILESLDGGVTYVPHTAAAGMSDAQGIAFLYNPKLNIGNSKTWLVGGGYSNGIYRTADAGNSWTEVNPAEQDHGGFDAHYSTQGFVYIGANDGLYRSIDNGLTWVNEAQGALKTWTYGAISDGKRLYYKPAFVGQPDNLPMYVSTEGGPNEGTQWVPQSTQIIPNGPFKSVFDDSNGIIYSANWSGGCWALTVN